MLGELSRALKSPKDQLAGRVESLMERAKRSERDLAAAKRKALTGGGTDDMLAKAKQVDGVTVLAANMGEAGANDLRAAGDVLKPKLAAGGKGAVLVLAGAAKGKVAPMKRVEGSSINAVTATSEARTPLATVCQ